MLHLCDGARVDVADPATSAAEAIRAGLIVAVKGAAGFHLACDATNEATVRQLRQRRNGDEKPFAVMVRGWQEAAALGVIGPEARRMLVSPERPIVLAQRNMNSLIAPSVALNSQILGISLPYSPLEQRLLAAAATPLAMAPGNRADDPIASSNDEALAHLRAIADLFLWDDGPIDTRCDDSVVAVMGGRATLVRRSLGYAPQAIALRQPIERPILACGTRLRSTFCLAADGHAWLGPHVGELENGETYDAYVSAIDSMERALRITPRVVACDLHPAYLSSTYACGRTGTMTVPVQHHHAHTVSAMAEHGIDGAAIGIAYDGDGYGTDGTMWGGEVLMATAREFKRVATFRTLPLVGGERAVREPWRLAVALLLDAYSGEPPRDVWWRFGGVRASELHIVRQMVLEGVNVPLARGVGRYFDAFGAFFLGRLRAAYEGQIALEWNQAADPRVDRTYQFAIGSGSDCPEVDLRPAVRAAVADAAAGEPTPTIAAAFHNTLAEATAALVRMAVRQYGRLPVVATGGCFQNAWLAEGVRRALAPEFDLLLHHEVPPGDGGIALGQAVIANAQVTH